MKKKKKEMQTVIQRGRQREKERSDCQVRQTEALGEDTSGKLGKLMEGNSQ